LPWWYIFFLNFFFYFFFNFFFNFFLKFFLKIFFNFLFNFFLIAGGYDGVFVFSISNDSEKILEDFLKIFNSENKINLYSFPLEICEDGLIIDL
jgi:hypothetical protein